VAVSVAAWSPAGARSNWLRAVWHYLPIAIVLLVWQLAVDLDLVDRAFLPSFSATLRALWEMTVNGEIAVNLLVSIYRALGGLAIGSAVGVAIGLAMATSRRADEFFGPLVATTFSSPACYPSS
jgi:ABC-type nitrate/sulfonate/bicarbonate transport system permease component